MSQTTISTKDRVNAQFFADFFRAYTEASDEVQDVIRSMVEIVNDEGASEDEVFAALNTLAEALFPSYHNGELGIDLEDLRTLPNAPKEALKEFDSGDAVFADRLSEAMKEKKMSQADLAQRIGIQQPAISMMLGRKCHPQRSTVQRLADALGIPSSRLWPGSSA